MALRFILAAATSLILVSVLSLGLANTVKAPTHVAGAPFESAEQTFEWPSYCIVGRHSRTGWMNAARRECWGPDLSNPILFYPFEFEPGWVCSCGLPVRLPEISTSRERNQSPGFNLFRQRPVHPKLVIPLLNPNRPQVIKISAPQPAIS